MPQRLLRSHKPSIGRLLADASSELDRLISEVDNGIRGAEHYNQLEVRVALIAKDLRAAFREGRAR